MISICLSKSYPFFVVVVFLRLLNFCVFGLCTEKTCCEIVAKFKGDFDFVTPAKYRFLYDLYVGLSPLPVRVTTRIITFLVGNPYKPSFPLLLGGGTTQLICLIFWKPNPIYSQMDPGSHQPTCLMWFVPVLSWFAWDPNGIAVVKTLPGEPVNLWNRCPDTNPKSEQAPLDSDFFLAA